MNEKGTLSNLIPFTKETAAERGRAGGLKSGETKRARKSMKAWAEAIGSIKVEIFAPNQKKVAGATLDAGVVMNQYRKAYKGDTRAAEFLAKLKGELKDEVELSGEQSVILVNSEEEKARLENLTKIGI